MRLHPAPHENIPGLCTPHATRTHTTAAPAHAHVARSAACPLPVHRPPTACVACSGIEGVDVHVVTRMVVVRHDAHAVTPDALAAALNEGALRATVASSAGPRPVPAGACVCACVFFCVCVQACVQVCAHARA